jgi:hypothetical protein
MNQVYSNPKSVVKYNPAVDKWEVHHGINVATFNRGFEGHKRALQLAITTDQPDLYRGYEYLKDTYRDEPGILARAYHGLKLAFDGYVLEPFVGNHNEVCRVASRTAISEYSIRYNRDNEWPYSCNCRDWNQGYEIVGEPYPEPKPKYGAPFIEKKGVFCKHVFAFMLAAYAKMPLLSYAPDSYIRAFSVWTKILRDLEDVLPDNAAWLDEIVPVGFGRNHLVLTVKENNDLQIVRFVKANWGIRLQESLNRMAGPTSSILLLEHGKDINHGY